MEYCYVTAMRVRNCDNHVNWSAKNVHIFETAQDFVQLEQNDLKKMASVLGEATLTYCFAYLVKRGLL